MTRAGGTLPVRSFEGDSDSQRLSCEWDAGENCACLRGVAPVASQGRPEPHRDYRKKPVRGPENLDPFIERGFNRYRMIADRYTAAEAGAGRVGVVCRARLAMMGFRPRPAINGAKQGGCRLSQHRQGDERGDHARDSHRLWRVCSAIQVPAVSRHFRWPLDCEVAAALYDARPCPSIRVSQFSSSQSRRR